MEPIEFMGTVFGVMSTFGGFIALVVGIITNTSKFKNWHHDRINRDANLDALASNTDLIKDLVKQAEVIDAISERVDTLDSKLRRALTHNKRQDRQIRDSIHERKLFMIGLIALFDWAIASGANGVIKEAYNNLRNYQYHRTHNFESYEEEV